ncbi:MAG: 2,3-cyclic 3-phosphodiesterase [Gaiellaceae bacterium]|nr:2,3-cyclic 3-phosphodiesterase [Gaiellaceae bacterium]
MTDWYWGATVRVDAAAPLLTRLTEEVVAPGVHVQRPDTAHVTLLYAPLRAEGDCTDIATRVRGVAERQAPFKLVLSGLGEFATATRVVAWLGVEQGADELVALRDGLCNSARDVLPYVWRPHCTLLYAEQPDAYAVVRPAIGEVLSGARIEVEVDTLWIAGFPATGHAAHDLEYRLHVPLRH